MIRTVKDGPVPDLAVNVRIWWKKKNNGSKAYSYHDTLSTPHLKVTNHRVITYRLLDYKEWIVFDKIEGLTGRPTTGLLGFLFQIIGEGRVVESRFAVSSDGMQINRARAEKAFFSVHTTVTVKPDGHTSKDVPPDRPDLLDLEMTLKKNLEIDYLPFD